MRRGDSEMHMKCRGSLEAQKSQHIEGEEQTITESKMRRMVEEVLQDFSIPIPFELLMTLCRKSSQ